MLCGEWGCQFSAAAAAVCALIGWDATAGRVGFNVGFNPVWAKRTPLELRQGQMFPDVAKYY